MRASWLCLFGLVVSTGYAADASTSSESLQFTTLTGTISVGFSPSSTTASSTSGSGSTQSTSTTTSEGSTSTVTVLVGGVGLETLSVINGTTTLYPNTTSTTTTNHSTIASSTTTSAQPTNTQPCNGWTEFCERQYGNVTEVAAHNAFFHVVGNAASNQIYGLTTQLNDGIRMITGETHYVNDTIYCCHTSCDLLNAGTLLSNLQEIAAWVGDHPYDVVTLLLVNSDFRPVEDYVDSIQGSGLAPYLYVPPKVPMRLQDWPTLSEMILTQKRVVIFMDYDANQTSVNYVIDEFASIWETPFSPQNISFPCDVQRPPSLTNLTEARDDFMYLANHNLNQAVSFAGIDFLIPNTAVINNTNAAGYETGMMGLMARNCEEEWGGKPPTWLLVDYYNTDNGSVFEVAARLNNVTWDGKCCGTVSSGALPSRAWSATFMVGALASVLIFLA